MGKPTGFIEFEREVPTRRPVAERVNDWKEIYEARKPLYERLATFEIDTSAAGLGKTLDDICEKLETL